MDKAKFLDCRGLAIWALRTLAPLRYTEKFDSFLRLDCANPLPPTLRNPRKAREQILPSGNIEADDWGDGDGPLCDEQGGEDIQQAEVLQAGGHGGDQVRQFTSIIWNTNL